MEGDSLSESRAAPRSLPDSAHEEQACEGEEGEGSGSNMACEGADRATRHVRSVGMSPIAVGKGMGSRRHEKEHGTKGQEDTNPLVPIIETHGQAGLFLLHPVRIPP